MEPATLPWLEALAEGDEVFTTRFGIPVVPGWAVFPEAIPRALAAARAGGPATWGTHLFFDDDGALVGFGGWKGEPVGGVAELGYAVAPARRGRGIATAVVRQLVDRGRAAGVQLVVAHTLPETSASTTVLVRCGFVRAGEADDPNGGVVWRWELRPGPIYHLALREEWDAAVAEGSYRRSTLGRSLAEEGFIHCSFAHQVEGVADLFYKGRSDVVRLTVDPSRLGSAVRVEGGFPHIYGPLPIEAVVDVEPLRMTTEREVTLRSVREGRDVRHLAASITAGGDLYIEGQDLGPAVEEVFGVGVTEYEWSRTVSRADLPALLGSLEAEPGEDILDVLARRYSGDAAAGLDGALDRSGVPVARWSRTGD